MKAHAQKAREALYERMEEDSAALLFSGTPPHKTLDQYYDYTPQRNFFYVSNISEPNMILLLMKGGSNEKTLLFIEENTKKKIQWEGATMSKQEASERSGIPESNIYTLNRFNAVFNQLMNYARSPMGVTPKALYLDLYHPSFEERPEAIKQASTIIKNYPELEIRNVNEHLSYLRMFKSDEEIQAIREAINHTQKGLDTIMENLGTRTHEYQLEADFLHRITLEGSEGTAFDTIAANGENAAILHYTDNTARLGKDNMILFDLGALNNNYAADISRTYPVSGIYSRRQREIYEIVLDVNMATIEQVRPGVTWKELNTFARERLAEHAKRIGLIEETEELSEYYYHGIGHFLGLDVHDVGHYSEPFKAGMVLTIEPGLYIKEEGIGVRIEDDILVTDNGCENLSTDIEKDPDALESMIRSR